LSKAPALCFTFSISCYLFANWAAYFCSNRRISRLTVFWASFLEMRLDSFITYSMMASSYFFPIICSLSDLVPVILSFSWASRFFIWCLAHLFTFVFATFWQAIGSTTDLHCSYSILNWGLQWLSPSFKISYLLKTAVTTAISYKSTFIQQFNY
jgi:hypothetical protein